MMQSVADVAAQLERQHYLAGPEVATALYLALRLEKPLLVEGPAGVGKTEIAKVLAAATGRRLIRLQCHEGLDAASALYDWNYPRQLLHIQLEAARGALPASEQNLYSEAFLLRRPLLEAITAEQPPVLLIDEADRADEEFEAFLLELLSDFQITIPELGTVAARVRPAVILTSNRTRELTDALRRRCLYLWIGYPTESQEAAILEAKVPGASAALARRIARFLHVVRGLGLTRAPGTAEALDWAAALVALGRDELDEPAVTQTLGAILKHQQDQQRFRGAELLRLLAQVGD